MSPHTTGLRTVLITVLSYSYWRPVSSFAHVVASRHGNSKLGLRSAVSAAHDNPQAPAFTVIFVRHGQSDWNLARRFIGWVDSPLTEVGVVEAKAAGTAVGAANRTLDVVFTSYLKRAVKTAWLLLEHSDQCHVPVVPLWRLNERHVGCLVGHTMDSAIETFGHERVRIWRTTLDIRPDPLDTSSPYYPTDERYTSLPSCHIPPTECLLDVRARVAQCWDEAIAPAVRAGKRVAVVAHENSLRALLMHIDPAIPDSLALSFEVPRATPIVYEFDEHLRPIRYAWPTAHI